MSEPTERPTNADVDPALQSVRGRSRRRLLQGGLGAAPVLLTLVSRPVLGATQCFTPSGFVSMPTSMHGQPQYCSGLTPGYWKQPQHFDAWVGYYPTTTSSHQATLFNTVFGLPSPYSNSTTFLDVLGLQGGPPDDVARNVTAEVLNIAAGFVPVLTIPQVIGIWREYISTGGGTVGYYEPTAGVKWYHDDIVTYLKSTVT